jgi:hypothetical protein
VVCKITAAQTSKVQKEYSLMLNVRRFASPAVASLLGVMGCSPVLTVRTAKDPSAEFPSEALYSWARRPGKMPNDPRIDNAKLEQRVRTAVKAELATKGYTFAEEGRPDFFVGYHVILQESLKPSIVSRKYGYGAGLWGDALGPDFEKGTLILDVIDPKRKKLVWRGIAEAELDLSVSDAEKQKRTAEAVRQILEGFPPK